MRAQRLRLIRALRTEFSLDNAIAMPMLKGVGALKLDTMPSIDVSGVSKQSQAKTLMVMLQEPTTMRVLWLGWSTAEVDPGEFASTTRAAIGEIISRVPGARTPTAVN